MPVDVEGGRHYVMITIDKGCDVRIESILLDVNGKRQDGIGVSHVFLS